MSERFDSYEVTFTFDTTQVSTTVMALSAEAAKIMAKDQVYSDLGFSDLSSFLHGAEDVSVTCVDTAVGMEDGE